MPDWRLCFAENRYLVTTRALIIAKLFPKVVAVSRFGTEEPSALRLKRSRYVWSCRGVAQPGRASGSGPEGRWFESSRPDFLNEEGARFPSVRLRPLGHLSVFRIIHLRRAGNSELFEL